ncbi:MAG: AlpA family phage regulatory protein [Gemmatimonadaceae bacterium]|nr:AlpA family phage regulatory protein [Gemmatimonadaceae bacterium]
MTGPELWGIAEVAEALDVDRSTVYEWQRRSDFPRPVARLRMGPVWEAEALRDWRRQEMRQRRKRRKF